MSSADQSAITPWIAELFSDPAMLRMGHNQRAEDLNLGLGWLYYALGRIVRPRTSVVIGSYRGFVPLVLGRALKDNQEGGSVLFIDPSMVNDFWKDPRRVQEHFDRHGVTNVRHFLMTTQEFVQTETYRDLNNVGMVFVDGYHSEEQARFDYEAFQGLLAPRGVMLFHDSMVTRQSTIYGPDRGYEMRVKHFVDTVKKDPTLETFSFPFGTGLTVLRKLDESSAHPLYEGLGAGR